MNRKVRRYSKWVAFFILCCGYSVPGIAQEEIYAVNHVMEIKIYFESKDWEHLLDSLKQAGEDDRMWGDIVVDGTRYDSVGIRYKGNSSYFNVRKTGSGKLPFNIKLDYKDKEHELPGGIKKIKLANVFRDPSFLREVLSYEIARKYMPAPQANFAKVYVNDEYLGLYNNTESIDDEFLDKHFEQHKGTLLKCDPNWHTKVPEDCPKGDKASLMHLGDDKDCYKGSYELESKEGWEDLIYFTKVLNHEPEKLDSILNIDQALWMLAFNSVLVNLDSYTGRLSHNYYLYKDTFGIFHPLVWDMNLSFGGFRFLGLESIPLTNEEMQELSPFVHYKERNDKRPLIIQLLRNNLYRKIYLAHIRTIVEENFANGEYLENAKKIQSIISSLVQADSNKLYTYEAFETNLDTTVKANKQSIIGIKELMEERSAYLLNHPVMNQPLPKIDKVEHTSYNEELAITASIADAEKAWLFYRYDPHHLFQKIPMYDDGGHNDQQPDDGIWGATIEPIPGAQYYIVAEGKTEASLSPKRAAIEYHKVGEQLNK